MEAKLAKNIFFSVICSLLLLGGVLGVVFGIIQRPDTNAFDSTYTETDNAVVVSEIWNGSSFDPTNTKKFIQMLANSDTGTVDTISNNIGSGTINATTLRGYNNAGNASDKSIVVTLGGFKWIVTYLFKDSSGNTCATLWMADANGTSTYGNSSSYDGSIEDYNNGYPSSMYGTSYVAVATLNNGGSYANITSDDSNATSLISYASSNTHQYAAFTHSSGHIRPYIVQPNKVPYQTSSQGINNGQGLVLMNESLATNLTGYSSTYNYQGKTGYTNWGDDYLWLPSLSETGNSSSRPGIWQTSQAERANSTKASWSRSGYYSYSRSVYYLYMSGNGGHYSICHLSLAIRPALHLNLTKIGELFVTINFDQQGGTGDTSSITAAKGSAMPSITIPTRTGYTFGGYYSSTNGGGTQYYTATGASATTYPSSGGPTTLYAKWTANTYYVKYDANGGSGTMSNSTHTYGTASKLTANAFSRTGYTFLGWSTSNTATSATYANQASVSTLTTTAGGTVTLYAVWQANTYYVKYNGNGATSGSMNNSTHKYGTASNLTNNGYSKTGYTFAGWATSSTGMVAYGNGASVSTLTATNGATVELFAKWTANTYTVVYNANGGSGTMQNSSHTYDIAKNLTKNAFSRDGFLFLGWSTSNSATTPTYTDEQSVTNLATSGTVNLYAVWKLNILISVTANNDNAGSVEGTGYYETGDIVKLKALVNIGYTLLYWAELDDKGNEIAQFVINPLEITVTESKTYQAVFGKAVEGVGVSATKGGVVYLVGDDFDSLEDNDTVTLSAKLVLEGYTFSHWEDVNGNNLGTEMSVKLKKSVVMDNLITAVFVSATNNNVNNNTSN